MFLFFKGVAKKLCGERPKNDDDLESQRLVKPASKTPKSIFLQCVRSKEAQDADPATKYGTNPEQGNLCSIQ